MGITVSKLSILIPPSSKNYVVSDITHRNQLTGLFDGDIAFVQDASADPSAKPNKWATYMYVGGQWFITSTQDAAVSDTSTKTIILDATTASSGTIFTTGSNIRVYQVEVQVPAGLSSNPTLTVGDATVADRLFSAADANFAIQDTYFSSYDQLYASPTAILYSYNPDTNTASGNITVIVSYHGA